MDIITPERKDIQGTAVATWRTSDLIGNFLVATSLPHDEPGHKMWILEIIDSDCTPGADLIGMEFYLGEYIVHPVELSDKVTGEVVVCRRSIFPQPDGPAISFVSEGVIRSLEKIAWALGRQPPWDPPVRVKLRQVSTGRGRRTFKLIPVEAKK